MGDAQRKEDHQEKVRLACEEYRQSHPTLVLTIAQVGGMVVIGELDGVTMKRPRIISLMPSPDGKGTMIGMSPLIGSPEEVDVLDQALRYEVSEKEIVNLYIMSTTNIQIASSIPPNVKLFPGKS